MKISIFQIFKQQNLQHYNLQKMIESYLIIKPIKAMNLQASKL